jgi:hypothetical protein
MSSSFLPGASASTAASTGRDSDADDFVVDDDEACCDDCGDDLFSFDGFVSFDASDDGDDDDDEDELPPSGFPFT